MCIFTFLIAKKILTSFILIAYWILKLMRKDLTKTFFMDFWTQKFDMRFYASPILPQSTWKAVVIEVMRFCKIKSWGARACVSKNNSLAYKIKEIWKRSQSNSKSKKYFKIKHKMQFWGFSWNQQHYGHFSP